MAVGRGEGLRRLGLLAAVVAILAVYTAIWARGESWLMFAWAGYPVVGALVLASRPGNTIGRLMLLIGGLWVVSGLALGAGDAAFVPAWLEIAATAAGFLVWCALVGLVALFPSGRAGSRLGRGVLASVVVVAGVMSLLAVVDPAPLEGSGRPNPVGVEALAGVSAFLIDGGGFLLVPFLMALAMVDLLLRWRRSDGARRLQYRWFLFAVTVQVAVLVLTFNAALVGPVGAAVPLLFNLIPIAVGIAVTRHGLYEIDRVVSRTLAYALVTATVVGTYAVVVTSLPRLLPVSSTLAVATATLLAAAVFRPVLRRVQGVVDRRFNRERYDAERIVDAFGARLREATDPDEAVADMVAAVEGALAPAAVGVWVRDGTVRR